MTPPPINIDGSDITGATIDGTDVQEVTVDGTQVFSAIPDSAGKHYYLPDGKSGDIEYYTLSTPYDLATRTKQFTFNATDRANIVVSPDGSRAIIYEGVGTGKYLQFDLTTPFDLSTHTSGTEVSNLPDAGQGSIQLNDDGSRLYISEQGNNSFIEQFDLSTPFDITTATSAGTVNLGRGGQTGQIAFNQDGSKLIFGERSGSKIYSTNLSVPFDITTTGSFTSFTTDSVDPSAIAISADGQKLFIRHWSPDIVAEYHFGTPYDITTLVYQGDKISTGGHTASHQFSINPFQV